MCEVLLLSVQRTAGAFIVVGLDQIGIKSEIRECKNSGDRKKAGEIGKIQFESERCFWINFCGRPLYSSRSTLAGSILAILSVGAIVARSVTAETVSATTRMVGASYTPTP